MFTNVGSDVFFTYRLFKPIRAKSVYIPWKLDVPAFGYAHGITVYQSFDSAGTR